MGRSKAIALLAAGVLVFSSAGISGSAEAAIGGMRAPRMTTPRTAPRMNTPKPRTPHSSPQTPRPNQQYRSSQKAGSLPSQAPSQAPSHATSPRTGNMNSVPVNGTRWGNMMRSIGLLAGGMMLGGLLGRLFGFGAGSFMADLLGLFANICLIGFVFLLLKRLWHAFSGRSSRERNPYATASQETEHDAPFPIRDIRPPQDVKAAVVRSNGGENYEPKRTADWYRSR